MGSSPLTRGKLLSSFCVGDGGGLIPAHAGKTEADRCPVVQSWAHPRSRGENLLLVLPSGSIQGSSPLTRGKRRARHSCSARRRLIPAHAGKTRVALNQAPFARAHPRSRGENFVRSRARLIGLGSSPLTRGKHDRELRRRHVPGLIPAHAGKTAFVLLTLQLLTAHPRSRGENGGCTTSSQRKAGSSPLTRGKLAGAVAVCEPVGLIPAHAGKTVSALAGEADDGAHPRSRGENVRENRGPTGDLGSSPLTRGKHKRIATFSKPRGLIPAHAGKTPLESMQEHVAGAHPRSRGENSFWRCGCGYCSGSSPLTRGKRGTDPVFCGNLGLIPAHAGKTSSGL